MFGLFDFINPHLSLACLIFNAVIIPLPIGLLNEIDIFKIASKQEEEIKSKCGVFPLMMHPKATKASNLLICFFIAIGISKTPGTFKILTIVFFFF